MLFTLLVLGQNILAQIAKKPNVLIIIVDDLGFKDLSLNGSKLYQTPNIDLLANQGVNFQNAYASYPRCVPSRYALMTGTYPINEDHGSLSTVDANKSFVQTFNKAGYTSFYVGKWHLGSDQNSPKGIGFENSFAAGDAGGTDTHFYPFNVNRVEGTKGEKAPIADVTQYGKEGDFLSDILTDKTIDYIQGASRDPFFGILAFYAVHTPIEAKPADIERNKKELKKFDITASNVYAKEGNGETRMIQNDPTYAGLVENTDENIGRIIQALKSKGILENTLIVITSDHGGLSTKGKNNRIIPTSNAPYRAGKGWLYEGGIKVPLVIYFPAMLKPKKDNESILLGMDLFPTLAELVLGQSIKDIDGKSFAALLTKDTIWRDRTVFWNSYKARPTQTGDNKTSVIRKGDYKLLHFIETDSIELYNVKVDTSERTNLSTQMPEKVQELRFELNAWKKENQIRMKDNHKSAKMENKDAKADKKETKKAKRRESKQKAKTIDNSDNK